MLASILVGKVNERGRSRFREGGFSEDLQKKGCLSQDLKIEWMGRIHQVDRRLDMEIGIDIYTLLYIKWVTNENLLYSTGNSSQYPVMTYMGKESKKEQIYVYV